MKDQKTFATRRRRADFKASDKLMRRNAGAAPPEDERIPDDVSESQLRVLRKVAAKRRSVLRKLAE